VERNGRQKMKNLAIPPGGGFWARLMGILWKQCCFQHFWRPSLQMCGFALVPRFFCHFVLHILGPGANTRTQVPARRFKPQPGHPNKTGNLETSHFWIDVQICRPSRGYGATVARLTPDQKVGSSNLSALIFPCFLLTRQDHSMWHGFFPSAVMITLDTLFTSLEQAVANIPPPGLEPGSLG
jgi:hypothetical protein